MKVKELLKVLCEDDPFEICDYSHNSIVADETCILPEILNSEINEVSAWRSLEDCPREKLMIYISLTDNEYNNLDYSEYLKNIKEVN